VAGLVDIHTHLLPGVDDGPEDLDGSLEMARAAVAAGISTIAATPHLRSDFPGVRAEEIGPRCQELQAALDQRGIPLRVVPGAEVSLVWALEASDEQLKLASYGQRGSDLLIETPTEVSMIESLLTPLRSKGFRITLAHPERSHQFQRDPEKLEHLVHHGVLLQVNAAALLRRRGPPGALADHLCRAGIAHAVGSDGHRAKAWRPVTDLPAAAEPLAALVGVQRARWMMVSAPGAIAGGASLPHAPPLETMTRRGWFDRLR
jgi:protein-tyrosine phosphatase